MSYLPKTSLKKSISKKFVDSSIRSNMRWDAGNGNQVWLSQNGAVLDVILVVNGVMQHDTNKTFFKGDKKFDFETAQYMANDYMALLMAQAKGVEVKDLPLRWIMDSYIPSKLAVKD